VDDGGWRRAREACQSHRYEEEHKGLSAPEGRTRRGVEQPSNVLARHDTLRFMMKEGAIDINTTTSTLRLADRTTVSHFSSLTALQLTARLSFEIG
jgi:hypothetical protein